MTTATLPSNDSYNNILLFINGTIYSNNNNNIVEAFAVDGETGRIVAIGNTEDILNEFPSPSSTFNFNGKTVTPGFIEGHAHLMSLGSSLASADLTSATSEEDCIEILTPFFEQLPVGSWLLARGWNNERWNDTSFPTKKSLDDAFGLQTFAYLTRVDGHAAWVSSAALNLADLPDEDPSGGQIIRDENGDATGVLIDTAMDYVSVHIPPPTEEENEISLEKAIQECIKYGITSVHDAGSNDETVQRIIRFIDEDRFDLRVYLMISAEPGDYCDKAIVDYQGKLTVNSVKLMLDGALGSYGAAMIEPYTDDPSKSGTIIIPYPTFVSLVEEWLSCGFQVNTHAIGDKANRHAVYGYLHAARNLGIVDELPSRRLRVEHTQIVHPDDFEIFQTNSIIASMQPTHATSDMLFAEDRIGAERILGAYAWKTFLNLSVPLIFGSDFPVEPVNPLIGFYSAVTRMDPYNPGTPPDGWYAEECVTREEALTAFTKTAAFGAFQENDLGSIDVGYRADFVVFDKNIMTIVEEDILTTKVLFTFIDGKMVYSLVNTS